MSNNTLTGEANYDVDIVKQLREHSSGNKATYAYYFTERYDLITVNPMFNSPSWLKVSATHVDELPFLFGAAFLKEESSPIWEGKSLESLIFISFSKSLRSLIFTSFSESLRSLIFISFLDNFCEILHKVQMFLVYCKGRQKPWLSG